MKYLPLIGLCLILPLFAISQTAPVEVKLDSKIEKVTVFLEGAQIERVASKSLSSGKTVLVLEKLSPFIDVGSISVEGNGSFSVLGVNHRRNFLEQEKQTEEVKGLQERATAINDSIILEQSLLTVWAEEEQFLRENRNIKGAQTGYELEDLQAISAYYTERIRTIKKEQLAANKRILALNERLQKINRQIQELQGKQVFGWSEIVIQVQAESKTPGDFKISYLCGNAGWFPTYDLWVKSVEEDVELVYQANLRQDTREDWEDVKLAFSNAEPNQSGQAPTLYPYLLSFENYYDTPKPTVPGYYGETRNFNSIRGQVLDQATGEPLIGATIIVSGSTVGTVTDFNGYYELTLPSSAQAIEVSYIGYENGIYGIGGSSTLNISLSEGGMLMDEIVVAGVASARGLRRDKKDKSYEEEDSRASYLATETVEYSTSFEFLLDIPYTIVSSKETVKLDLNRLDIPASYNYITVPKIDETAYLLATVTEWEQYNLLEGEVSLHFEKTFVGKSILDVSYATDSLFLSLGRDKGIIVDRENIKEFSKRRILGTKQIDSRHYRTTIRNTKRQAVSIEIRDQIPLSTNKQIEVESLDISGGTLDEETGEIVWQVQIAPGQTITLDNKYEVKYPKDEFMRID